MDSKDSSSGGGDKSHRRHALSIDARGKLLAASGSPCGACKFLRRKCLPGCVFAPHFASEQGPERFAAVHRVFGASNASKLLSSVPVGRRHDAAVTICFEAQARLADPVYGCVATILALQQQVTSLQTDLSIMHSQLLNCQLAIANSLHGLQQAQHMAVLQPAYSNNSSAPTDMVDVRSFPVSLDLGDTMPPSRDFEPLPLSQPSQDDQEEETSQDHVAFVMHNEGFGPK